MFTAFATVSADWVSPGTALALLAAAVGVYVVSCIVPRRRKASPPRRSRRLARAIGFKPRKAALDCDDSSASPPVPDCVLADQRYQVACRAFGTHELSFKDIVLIQLPRQKGGGLEVVSALAELAAEGSKPDGHRPLGDALVDALMKEELEIPQEYYGCEIVCCGNRWHHRADPQGSTNDFIYAVRQIDEHDEPQRVPLSLRARLGMNSYLACLPKPASAQLPKQQKAHAMAA